MEIVLDTETTGLSVKDGHRIVEIGCIELDNLIPTKKQFQYTQKTLDNFGRIFSSEEKENSPLRKYSAKIYSIMDTIKKSEGIILIYSSYIDAGCVPIALALEEIGITRWEEKGGTSKSLFKKAPKKSIGKYVMITGDKQLSPSNKKELEIFISNA